MVVDVRDWQWPPQESWEWPAVRQAMKTETADALASRMGLVWGDRVVLDLTEFVDGIWRIHWSAELYVTPSASFGAQVRLVTDVGTGPVVLAGPAEVNKVAPGTTQAGHWTGALSTDRVYRLQYRATAAAAAAWIQNARLMAIRK